MRQFSRHSFLVIFVAFLFGILIWRLLDLSYFSRDKYIKDLTKTRHSMHITPARRGNIYDRNLEILATDQFSIIVGVDPYSCDIENDLSKICTLAELLDMDYKEVLQKFIKKSKIINSRARKNRWVPICEITSNSLRLYFHLFIS